MSASRAFSPLDLAQLLAVAAIWGANNIAAKVALATFPPLMTVAMRFGVVLLVLLPFLKPPPAGTFKLVLPMVVLMGPVHFGLLYLGLSLAHDVGPMVIAMQLWAPFSVLFASIFLG
ncbi:MAG: EamA family transporter, partial [Pseudomonadota bacterium]